MCVCVICTLRGGSLCSDGQDAPFGSGLLRPLWNVGPPPSAESEPLWLAGYVSSVFALPCLVRKSGRATSSATASSGPCGTGTGGDCVCAGTVCVCVCVLGGGGDILWVRMECLSHCLPLQLSAPIASTLLLALACFKFTHSQTTNLLLEGALHRR